jgi:signal peptidase I
MDRLPIFLRVLGRALAAAVALLLTAAFLLFAVLPALQLGRVVAVLNQGMSPRIAKGDFIYLNQLAYIGAAPARGDVVCFRGEGLPTLVRQNDWQVKRIAGLPNETISIRSGAFFTGETPAPELTRFSYQEFQFDLFLTRQQASYPVPAQTYFVLGDNPDGSYDSRFFGPVPRANIKGKALFRLWPLSRLGWIN